MGAHNLESSAGEIMNYLVLDHLVVSNLNAHYPLSTISHVIASSAHLLTLVQPQRTRSTTQ